MMAYFQDGKGLLHQGFRDLDWCFLIIQQERRDRRRWCPPYLLCSRSLGSWQMPGGKVAWSKSREGLGGHCMVGGCPKALLLQVHSCPFPGRSPLHMAMQKSACPTEHDCLDLLWGTPEVQDLYSPFFSKEFPTDISVEKCIT